MERRDAGTDLACESQSDRPSTLHLHLPAEPGVGQLPLLIFAGGGGEGSGEERHSEVEKGEGALKRTSVKLVDCLASFSRRKTVPHGQMGNCRCSWLGLFRVFR